MRRLKIFDVGIGLLVSVQTAILPLQTFGSESMNHTGPHDVYIAHTAFRTVQDWRSGKFDLSGYRFQKEDRAVFDHVRKKLSSAFQFEVKDNLIAIRHPGMAAVLEFRGDQIFLNGERFEISADRPIQSSLRNWALRHKKRQGSFRAQSSPFLVAINGAIPAAEAQLDPMSYAVATTMAQGGDMAAFGMNLAMGQAIAGSSSAAIGSGAALTATGVAAVLGGTAVAIAAVAGVGYCEIGTGMTRSMRKRLNCYSEPLSWLGVNPRDRLYVQDLVCRQNDKQGYEKIKVSMASSRGDMAAREFVFKDDKFIEFTDDANSRPFDSKYKLKPGYGILDPLSPSEKKYFQEVEKEAMRLRAICHDEKAYAEFRAATRQARKDDEVGTSQPPSRPIRVTK
ncbi:MAG: hypothetical protein JNJ49_08400 [Bdellovibrionaceae bacterium]|nr:hypothetical protein [Pseudobdellovibrionaceae bacterium]